jgi:hypothetical protein
MARGVCASVPALHMANNQSQFSCVLPPHSNLIVVHAQITISCIDARCHVPQYQRRRSFLTPRLWGHQQTSATRTTQSHPFNCNLRFSTPIASCATMAPAVDYLTWWMTTCASYSPGRRDPACETFTPPESHEVVRSQPHSMIPTLQATTITCLVLVYIAIAIRVFTRVHLLKTFTFEDVLMVSDPDWPRDSYITHMFVDVGVDRYSGRGGAAHC